MNAEDPVAVLIAIGLIAVLAVAALDRLLHGESSKESKSLRCKSCDSTRLEQAYPSWYRQGSLGIDPRRQYATFRCLDCSAFTSAVWDNTRKDGRWRAR